MNDFNNFQKNIVTYVHSGKLPKNKYLKDLTTTPSKSVKAIKYI